MSDDKQLDRMAEIAGHASNPPEAGSIRAVKDGEEVWIKQPPQLLTWEPGALTSPFSGGDLTGQAIRSALELGSIVIDPFDDALVNDASVDVTLGAEVAWYTGDVIDARKDNPVKRRTMSEAEGFLVLPGMLYLMHTRERIKTDWFKPVIGGKSSIGRLGLIVHHTAGEGDPGFDGQFTLEVSATGKSVRIYPGMRIAQVSFRTLVGEVSRYRGNYTGGRAQGPVASRSYAQEAERLAREKKTP